MYAMSEADAKNHEIIGKRFIMDKERARMFANGLLDITLIGTAERIAEAYRQEIEEHDPNFDDYNDGTIQYPCAVATETSKP